jgi:lipoprotein NlpD
VVVVLAVVLLAAGCANRRTPAPVVDARVPAKPVVAKPIVGSPVPKTPSEFYTVKRGDTLYSIALDHGADYRDLVHWNDLEDATRLRLGQQLRVKPPLVAAEPSPPAVQIGTARILGRVESRPLDALPPLPPRAAPKTEIARMELVKPTPAPVKSDAPTPANLAGFIWPVKGKVLAEFAEPRRKGIDIDGRPGDPIVAAAAGRVTYIGSGIPGMGKLVVLKHDNGFITVYGHNREILVKEQQAVARGQQIAVLGSTDAERPKLHFQIRKGAAAVDPLLYLPK